MSKSTADHKVFSLIFSERRGKPSSRHQHPVRPRNKRDDEFEIIVPPSMRKNQNFITVTPPIHQREPEFYQNRSGGDNLRPSFCGNDAVPLKIDPELRDEASLSSLDKDIIQPSSRPHLNPKNIGRIPPSQHCLVRSRTLQSRLPIPRQNATLGLLAPIAYDQRSYAYNKKAPNSFHEMQREIKQIILETQSVPREEVHISKTESRDDIHESPTSSTTNAESTEEAKQDPVTESEPPCTWWKCW